MNPEGGHAAMNATAKIAANSAGSRRRCLRPIVEPEPPRLRLMWRRGSAGTALQEQVQQINRYSAALVAACAFASYDNERRYERSRPRLADDRHHRNRHR